MTKLLWLVVFILDIWAIINVLQSAAKPIEKALWIVLILVLPLIGFVMLILEMDKKGHRFKVYQEPRRPLCPKEDDSVLKKKS